MKENTLHVMVQDERGGGGEGYTGKKAKSTLSSEKRWDQIPRK